NLREDRSAYWDIEQWQTQSKSFADMAAFDPASVTLTRPDRTERISVLRTTPHLLSLLGIQPLQGRIFSVEETQQRQHFVLSSHRLWQTRFGGSRNALGATIELDGIPSRIIGILPETSQFPQINTDVWEPHTMLPDWETARSARGEGAWFVIARLQQNVS